VNCPPWSAARDLWSGSTTRRSAVSAGMAKSRGKGGSKAGGKSEGKGWSKNVPGMPNSTIDYLPEAGIAVFRESADQAVDFCDQLRIALESYEYGEAAFENVDVATVEWSTLSFQLLLDVLQEKNVSTKRFKAFKCGLQDDCMDAIAKWLDDLPPDRLPSEIHLSHNQITEEGFLVLLTAIEAKRAELEKEMPPIWFRVESCKVDIASDGPTMGPLVQEGRVQFLEKLQMRTSGPAALALPLLDSSRAGSSARSSMAPGPPAIIAGASRKGGKGSYERHERGDRPRMSERYSRYPRSPRRDSRSRGREGRKGRDREQDRRKSRRSRSRSRRPWRTSQVSVGNRRDDTTAKPDRFNVWDNNSWSNSNSSNDTGGKNWNPWDRDRGERPSRNNSSGWKGSGKEQKRSRPSRRQSDVREGSRGGSPREKKGAYVRLQRQKDEIEETPGEEQQEEWPEEEVSDKDQEWPEDEVSAPEQPEDEVSVPEQAEEGMEEADEDGYEVFDEEEACSPRSNPMDGNEKYADTDDGDVNGVASVERNRSRTKARRAKSPSNDEPLPPGWEKHWSNWNDEYSAPIPYYWNRDTGESMWDAPPE